MVKIEAFFKLNFMHQAVRVCRTDHTDSIIAKIACSFNFNMLPESQQKLHSDCGPWYRYGENRSFLQT